jgi:hypothetical protein
MAPTFGLLRRAAPVMLRELLKQGDTKTVINLSLKAAKHGLRLLENCDDSDGLLGDILSEIAATHLEAASGKTLAPFELAKNFIELQLADGFGFFELENYLPALGKSARARRMNRRVMNLGGFGRRLLPGMSQLPDRPRIRRGGGPAPHVATA